MLRSSQATLIRRRNATQFEQGPRTLTGLSRPMRLAAPALMPATALACVLTDAPVAAITYDDGPDPEHTPQVLDALDAAGVKGTFFVLTDQAKRSPQIIRRMVQTGHEVALHGQDHKRISALPLREALTELRRARAELADIAGVPIRLYRPCFGALTLPQLLAVRAMGLEIVMWTAWSKDWQDDTTKELVDRTVAATHPGSIVLLHDASRGLKIDPATGEPKVPTFSRAGLTTGLVSALQEQDYRLLTVTELLAAAPSARALWSEKAKDAKVRALKSVDSPV